jgi:hypothetical protein
MRQFEDLEMRKTKGTFRIVKFLNHRIIKFSNHQIFN